MKNVRSFSFFLLGGALATAPLLVQAQAAGLVPQADKPGLCDIGKLAQNIIDFAIVLSIPLGAILIGYGGFLYITSGANPGNISKAKGIWATAIIGFIVAISGWLIVNTILFALFSGSGGPFSSNGSWFRLECKTGRLGVDTRVGVSDWLGQLPQSVFTVVDTSGADTSGGGLNPTTGCRAGAYLQDGQCLDSFGNTYTPYNTQTGCRQGDYLSDGQCTDSFGAIYNPQQLNTLGGTLATQLQAACNQYNMDSGACANLQRISINESSGGLNCTTSPTGAAGCMQVLARTACSTDSSISSSCGDCLRSGNSTSAQCAPVIQTISNDQQLGVNLGARYYNQLYNQYGGNCQLAAAAYYQGSGNVQKYGGVPPNAVSYVNKACG